MFLSVITAALRVVGRHNYPSWPTQFRGPATPLAKTGTGPRTINVSTSTERRRRRNLSFLPAERPGPVGRRAAAVISRHGSRRSELATAPAKVDCTYALKPLTSLVVWTSVTRSATADPKAV